MKLRLVCVIVGFVSLVLSLSPLTIAQTSTQNASALPRLVRFGGTVKDLNGSAVTGVVGITFALYSEKSGGAPLWLETQNAIADSSGHYTVLLGATKPDGLPAELFTSEQARWVGVQVSGQPEQPRVLLVSAPYALKAGDAETLGGLPPSAFVLVAPAAIGSAPGSSTTETVTPLAATDVTTTGGTADYLPIFSGAATIIDSSVFQTGSGTTGKIGIDTITPATQLDVNGAGTIRGTLSLPATGVATSAGGKNSQGLNIVASSFSSTSSTALNQVFRWQAEPAANDTTSPTGTLNLQYGLGTATPTETGLKVSSKGVLTFATGQTFPRTGTITGITTATGSGLTGGGTSGTLSLKVPAAGITNAMLATSYAQLGAANTFTANETVNGTITANSSTNAIVGNSSGTSGYGVEGSGNSNGVYGRASSTSGIGIYGLETAATGPTYGVFGESASTSGQGVQGFATATSGNAVGVTGIAQSPAGYGVYGANNATTGNIAGVYGSAASTSGTGVEGNSTAATGTTFGVTGTSESTSGTGVYGYEASTTGFNIGVLGQTVSPDGIGVKGISPLLGVVGQAHGSSGRGAPKGAGVWGDSGAFAAGVAGTANDNVAGFFGNASVTSSTLEVVNQTGSSGGEVFVGQVPFVSNGPSVLAIIGDPGCGAGDNRMAIQLSQGGMSNCDNYTLTAGNNGETYVNANVSETVHLRVNNVDSLVASGSGVNVVGTLSKGGGSFKIDHPLDPANKYLYHSFVESPDMMNIYNGNATTDGDGLATVTLPDWFESLNRDFRYQLTVIGQFAQAIVASKVANNQFRIQTDKPNVEVSWQVTGIRQDAFANANRIPVEVEKAPADRGRYLYPEAIGQPATARIGYEAPPPASEHIAHQPPTLSRRSNASPMVGRAPLSPPAPPTPTMQKPILPRPIQPQRTAPRVAPLPHPAGFAVKPEVNQK